MNRLPAKLRHLYPFAPRTHTTRQAAVMSYIDEGPRADTATLMLHGNPTWSLYYSALIQKLSPTQRCIAPDHIGMGLSDKPQNYPYTLAARIDDIEHLVEALSLKKLNLVVHDWGGAIGFGLATRRPELIDRIIILNTAAFPSPHIPRRIALCKSRFPGTFLNRGLNAFAGPATWMSMHRRKLTPDEKHAFLFPYDNWQNRVAIDAFVKDIPMTPSHPAWNTLQAIADKLPLLSEKQINIHWGARDFCFNHHFLEDWKRIYPQATVTEYPDAGHYILLDADTEILPRIAAQLG